MELADPQGFRPAAATAWSEAEAEPLLARLPRDCFLLRVPVTEPLPPGVAALSLNGVAVPPPTTGLRLPHPIPALLFAARLPADRLIPGTSCDMRVGEALVARFPLPESIPAHRLLQHQAGDSAAAILQFLAGNLAMLLRLDGERGFGELCHELALRLEASEAASGHAAAALTPVCAPGRNLSIWQVPATAPGPWFLLEPGGLRRLPAPQGGFLLLPGRVPGPDSLALPPAGAPFRFGPPPRGARPLAETIRSLAHASPETPPKLAGVLARRAAADPQVAALLRESQLLHPARPRSLTDAASALGGALEMAFPDRGGGVFLAGWLRDPLGLVARLELRSPFASAVVPDAALHRVARPDIAENLANTTLGGTQPLGFVAHLPEADHPAVAQWRLALRLRSGESVLLTAPPAAHPPAVARGLVLGALHPGAYRPEIMEHCIAPAAARLHGAALAGAAVPESVAIGAAPPARPRCAIVVPLYRNLRFLRPQVAAFARDPSIWRSCELIYVLDSPEQRLEVEQMLRALAALHEGLAIRLLVMPENRGYASACNAGAAAARAPVLLMLNSDVLPLSRGWIEPMLARLSADRRLGAVGPKLLFDDGTLQHAGMRFARAGDGKWLNEHYHKGLARHDPRACIARAVPAVTGAALMVRRRAYEKVGGFSTDYIVGDFEDSDLCLALRAAGLGIFYEPATELYHFERQSLGENASYARTLAAVYNRHLHHKRWDGAITALMARFAAED